MVLVRSANWFESKVPLLLTAAFVQILLQGLTPSDALPALLVLIVSVALLASYAHTVNDIFDVQADFAAGKPNTAAGLSPSRRTGKCCALAIAGLAVWLWQPPGTAALVALVAIVVLPLAYSAPPLRFKGRGAAGIVTDTAMAHTAPALFVSLVFAGLASEPHQETALVVVLVTAWSTSVGLRGILVHEIQDLRNDQAAGVRTFVVAAGVARARAICAGVLFPTEVCMLAALLVALARLHAGVAGFFLVYAVVFQVARGYWRLPQEPAPTDPGMRIALFEFYIVWPPVALAAVLAVRDPLFVTLVLGHIALFAAATRRQLREIASRVVPFYRMSGKAVLHGWRLVRQAATAETGRRRI